MKSSKEILSSILKTAQMGQVGIRTVEDRAASPALKQALEDQLREYGAIERQAHTIAAQRGWCLPELSKSSKSMAEMMTALRLRGQNKDSKIAAMMVTGNTKGVIKGLKNAHRYHGRDPRISALSQKLLDCENANIRQMEEFI